MHKRIEIFRALTLSVTLVAGTVLLARTAWASPFATPKTRGATIAAGTVITVQMIDPVDSSRNRPGDQFAATVAEPIVVGDQVIVPKGAEARIRLVEVKSAGHIKGQSELELELTELTVNGRNYSAETSAYTRKGGSRGKRSAEVIGGGAGLGALIGAVAGGGKGAAIGAAVGAGAGTAVQASTRGQQVKVPAEAKIEFRLRNSLTINK